MSSAVPPLRVKSPFSVSRVTAWPDALPCLDVHQRGITTQHHVILAKLTLPHCKLAHYPPSSSSDSVSTWRCWLRWPQGRRAPAVSSLSHPGRWYQSSLRPQWTCSLAGEDLIKTWKEQAQWEIRWESWDILLSSRWVLFALCMWIISSTKGWTNSVGLLIYTARLQQQHSMMPLCESWVPVKGPQWCIRPWWWWIQVFTIRMAVQGAAFEDFLYPEILHTR